MKKRYVGLLILFVLLLDQFSKIYIKTHFAYGETINIFGLDWARLYFVENEGMAFGITFDWEYGKLMLSLFRIGMVAGLFWYIHRLIAEKAPAGFVYCIGLITAGAIGNIIDSAFYGMIFNVSGEQSYDIAQFVPFGQGYAPFLHGKVVDMFYFPLFTAHFPEWMPGIGGTSYKFFSYIFNVADSAITIGISWILLFQRRFLRSGLASVPAQQSAPTPQQINETGI
jgi:signal peptidase II